MKNHSRIFNSFLFLILSVMLAQSALAQNGNKVVVIPLFSEPILVKGEWRGEWQEGLQYKKSDMVKLAGSSYISTSDHGSDASNFPPVGQFWDVVAESGGNGEQGDKGDMGLKGDKGDMGLKGDPGADGADGANGTNGTNGTNGNDSGIFIKDGQIDVSCMGICLDPTSGPVGACMRGIHTTFDAAAPGISFECSIAKPVASKCVCIKF
ncbi:MAG: hypothetical protein ACI9SP_000740 [Arenicella sp.]|jgi:hypothetical protein